MLPSQRRVDLPPPSIHVHSQPFQKAAARETDIVHIGESNYCVPRRRIFRQRQEFSDAFKTLCKMHLWHLKLRFAPLMIALTAAFPAPPGVLMYSGANVRVHTAHIKANVLHGSALAAAIKGFQRRYVCLRAAEAEISPCEHECVYANASNQM